MRNQKGTYQVINTKFRKNGIWWERKTTYERDKRIGVAVTLALTDNDKSVPREKPDFEKCVLCREAKRHTADLHEEMIEAWHSVHEGRKVEYVDDHDKMEWEILNAEGENRQINWGVTKEYGNEISLAQKENRSIRWTPELTREGYRQKHAIMDRKRDTEYTHQQIDAMWQGDPIMEAW